MASDPDDGVASLSYIWQVNGVQVSTVQHGQSIVDASVGDSLTCTAIAVDFEGTLLNLCWFYNFEYSSSSKCCCTKQSESLHERCVECLSTTLDFNGDNVTLSYEWHVMDASNNGQDTIVQVGAGSAFSSLDGSQMMGFDRDDEVYVNVTPNDGTDNGTTVESDHAVVLNTATRGDNYCNQYIESTNRDG